MDLKSTLLGAFVQYVVPTLFTAIGSLLVAGLGILTMWLSKKAKADGQASAVKLFLGVAEQVSQTASNVVAHIEAELKPDMVKAVADGVVTDEEATALKAKGMELLKASISTEAMAVLKANLGAGVDGFLSGLLERALTGLKTSLAVAEAPAPAAANP